MCPVAMVKGHSPFRCQADLAREGTAPSLLDEPSLGKFCQCSCSRGAGHVDSSGEGARRHGQPPVIMPVIDAEKLNESRARNWFEGAPCKAIQQVSGKANKIFPEQAIAAMTVTSCQSTLRVGLL